MASNVQANNHHSEHHVHFNDDFTEDNSIQYHGISNKEIRVHLGFLQLNHVYSLELDIPTELLDSKLDLRSLKLIQEPNGVINKNCQLVESLGVQENHLKLKIKFLATKEKLLKENLNLVNECQQSEQLRLVITARVLGRGKGTPMLRNGIHLIGIETDEETDASDWFGFSRSDKDDDL